MNLDTRSGPGMTCVYPDGGRDTVLLGGVPMALHFSFGVWLVGGKWFYLGGGGWNGGWWCWAFRRVAALPLPSFLQPPDPL